MERENIFRQEQTLIPECKDCEHLIVRYGFCQVIEDYVGVRR